MNGSLSIKYVLPAIWRNNAVPRDVPWFREYAATKDGVVTPYAKLPPLARNSGAFSPCVAVTVQRDASNLQLLAALLELSGTVASADA